MENLWGILAQEAERTYALLEHSSSEITPAALLARSEPHRKGMEQAQAAVARSQNAEQTDPFKIRESNPRAELTLRQPALLSWPFGRCAILLGGCIRGFLRRRIRWLVRRRLGCGFLTPIGSFLQFLIVLRFFGRRFGVGHVAEHLQASRVLLTGENPVLLVDGDSHQRFELAGHLSVSDADISQQLAFTIEDLKPVCHLVGHPDVPIAINCDALGPGGVSGSIAVFAEQADEVSVGIENFHPVVEGVGNVNIAVFIQRHALRHFGRVDQLAPLLDKLKSDPNNPVLLTTIGNLYYDAQQYPIAVDYYRRVLKARASYAAVRTDMATAYWYMGNADSAIAEFNQALIDAPNSPNTLFNLGLVKWKGKKDGAGALADWEQLLAANPNYEGKGKVEQMMTEVKNQAAVKPGMATN